MACGCGQSASTQYKVLKSDGSELSFGTYELAQAEINANGGVMRVTNEQKTA